jgi:nucleoside transporter
MKNANRTKLCIMMFLEYVIWGAWLPLLGLYIGEKYLKFDFLQSAMVFNAFAIAALTGMFFGGQLADRYMSQEKFLAISHLIGGLAMLALATQTSFWPFFLLMLLHCFFYVPTLSVTNAIAFANLKDAQKEFGQVRVWGTIGWIAAAWPFIFIPIDWAQVGSMEQAGGFVNWIYKALGTPKTGAEMQAALTSTFVVSGIASLLLAAFCLALPHTPPSGKTEGSSFAPADAFRKMFATPVLLILFIVTFLDSLVHYCYFRWTSDYLSALKMAENWIAPAMSIGQIAEIATMAYLGYFLKKLGWRTTMILGILGHVVRFGIYSIGEPQTLWLVILSNIVHGFAYAFFFATVYIFVDENFPKDIRTSAQSLFNLNIMGISQFVAYFFWSWLGDRLMATVEPGGNKIPAFHQLFLVPLGIGILSALVLVVFFHPPQTMPKPEDEIIPAEVV